MYTYVGFLWFEQNVAVRDDDAAQRIVIPPKDELVDQSGQGAERLVCIHGHPTELLRFKLRGTFSQKKSRASAVASAPPILPSCS